MEVKCEFDFHNDFYLGKNKTKWSIHKPPTNVRTRSINIVSHLPGPINAGRKKKNYIGLLGIIFNDDMLHCIVENTNKFILEKREEVLLFIGQNLLI